MGRPRMVRICCRPSRLLHENSKLAKYATTKWVKDGDHHLLIYVRDEETGGLKELWEYYQPFVTRNEKKEITAVAGAAGGNSICARGRRPLPEPPPPRPPA